MSAATVLHDDLSVTAPVRRPGPRHLRLVAPDERPVPRPRRAPARITRRGRLAVTSTAAAVLVMTAAGLAGAVMPGDPQTVTVRSGQTLSHIAATAMPDLPLDRAIVELQVANDLSSSQVQAGQILVIPSP